MHGYRHLSHYLRFANAPTPHRLCTTTPFPEDRVTAYPKCVVVICFGREGAARARMAVQTACMLRKLIVDCSTICTLDHRPTALNRHSIVCRGLDNEQIIKNTKAWCQARSTGWLVGYLLVEIRLWLKVDPFCTTPNQSLPLHPTSYLHLISI